MPRLLPLLFLLLPLACSTGDDTRRPAAVVPTSKATPPGEVKPEPVADCVQWRAYYAAALARDFLTTPWVTPCWGCETLDQGAPVGAANEGAEGDFSSVSAAAPSGGARDVARLSDTNVQEAGVDEADLIKADAATGLFYVVARPFAREVLVARAVPPESLSIASRLPIDTDGVIHGLYLDAERSALIVLVGRGGFWEAVPAEDGAGFARPRVDVLWFSLADDPQTPVLTAQYTIEGSLVDSRRIDGRLHLVTQFQPWVPASLFEDPEFFELVYDRHPRARQQRNDHDERVLAAAIRQRITDAVNDADLAELLPRWQGQASGEFVTLACNAVHAPRVEQRLGLVTVTSMDTFGDDVAHAAVANNAWLTYASREHLYLAQPSGGWWFDEGQTQQTAIVRLVLSDDAAARPDAHGMIDGWPLSSFSFSEFDGVLRAVTTEGRFVPNTGWRRTNHLFTLAPDAQGRLAELGSVRDFEPGESVFAARFLGERGYVVTFERIDPLFAFDLSDPAAPRIAGVLELPGFSTYLHPLGDDHLVALGREATVEGQLTGQLALQLFDVSALESPQLVQRVLIPADAGDGWSWSPAEHDPHAFTLADGLLSIPVQRWGSTAEDSFSGFHAYAVDTGGFAALGTVDHAVEDGETGDCPPQATDAPSDCSRFAPVHHSAPLRSVIGSDDAAAAVLYTLSDRFLKAHTGDTLAPIASADLAE